MERQSSIVIRKINPNDVSIVKENSFKNFVVHTKPPLPPIKRTDILNEAFSQQDSQPDKRLKFQVIFSHL
jgi:hypothetical protein